jgi:hypothetical protein
MVVRAGTASELTGTSSTPMSAGSSGIAMCCVRQLSVEDSVDHLSVVALPTATPVAYREDRSHPHSLSVKSPIPIPP